MKRNLKILSILSIFSLALFFGNSFKAHGLSLSTDTQTTSSAVSNTTISTDTVIVEKSRTVEEETTKSPTTFNMSNTVDESTRSIEEESETTESPSISTIESFSEVTQNIQTEIYSAEKEIRKEIDSGISRSIIEIKNSSSDTVVNVGNLNTTINEARREAFDDLSVGIKLINPTDSKTITSLEQKIEKSLRKIEDSLEKKSGVSLDLSSNNTNVKTKIRVLNDKLATLNTLLEDRSADYLYKDSDEDGVSDFDEVNIYKTDPQNAKTVEGELNDGEKILLNIDPTSSSQSAVQYEDPREKGEEAVGVYQVREAVVVETKIDEKTQLPEIGKVSFKGWALPNSFVTLYIYSTPIVVTVKTDNTGEWTYTLDKELEDGDHTMYVATVNSSGKIVAKSRPIPFVKEANAVTFNSESVPNENSGDFFKDNFILTLVAIMLAVLLIAIILVLIGIGHGKATENNIPPQNNV
jgi:hypothetical protein